jgi:hypothetical protein
MSSELETLDQLLGGNLSLNVVRMLYPDEEAFSRGVLGLLSCGDVRLLATDGAEVPRWQWQELFVDGAIRGKLEQLQLQITDQGIQRIA